MSLSTTGARRWRLVCEERDKSTVVPLAKLRAPASLARPLIALSGAARQVLTLRLADRMGKGIRSAPRDALLAESATPETLGLAFGTQRGLDHVGALVGPLVATALLLFVTHVCV